MKAASGALILARTRERNKSERGLVSDEVVSTLQIQDVEAEQRKYNNFWVGIQRRIELKKLNVRTDSTHVNKEKKNITKVKHIIHPLNNNKVLWDLLVCFLVIYSVIVIPLRIGFNRPPSLGFMVFDDMIDCLFFIDMIITFNTAYLDTHLETYVYSRKKIAQNYLQFWFWVDLVSTVPFDDIGELFATASSQLGAIRAVRILRLGRLAKLQRMSKLSDYLEEQFSISPSLMSLVMLMLQIFFVAHVFACFWHFLAMPSSTTSARTWITEAEFQEDSATTRYIAALYYTIVTMLTVGYGDIHPTNPSERAYSIFTMLSGCVIFGALLSKVASLIEKRQPQARAFKENMDEIRAFLEEYSLPLAVKAKAKEAYSYYLTKKSSFGESGIFDDLPQPLLFKLVLQLYEKDIKKVQMFCSYECSFVVTLVINSKPFQAARGEIIFNQGDVCKDIVFIPTGMVRLSVGTGSGKDVLVGFCTEGGYFGDMEFFRNSVVSLAQYSAMNNCELLSVSYQIMRQAIAENLDSGTNFNAEMTRRYAGFVAVTKSAVLGDLQSRGTTRGATFRGGRKSATNLQRLSSVGDAASAARNATARVSNVNKYGASQRRHSSTTGAHSSIWLNGLLRDHQESAHYIRMALRQSSDNLSDAARRRANDISSSNMGEASGESAESIISVANDEEVHSMSCRVLMKDEDGTQLIVDVSHQNLHRMLLIDPTELWKVRWDVFIALIIVYTLIVTPVEIAFYQKEPAKSFEVELVLDSLFFLDLILSFRTTFPSNVEAALVVDSWEIANAYLRSWFAVDLLSSIPYKLVLEGIFADNNLKSLKLLKTLRLFRLMKLARVFKLEVFISKLEDTLGLPRAAFELLQVLVEVFFIGHLVACLWWGISAGLSKNPWYTDTEMVYEDMSDAPTLQKYLISLYFTFTTMTTVGYGDISATNAGERILNILIILLGASMFGYIIANVSTIVEDFNRVESVQSNRISVIKEYLGEKNCPEALEKKVVAHFKHLFSITSAYNVDKIMSRLPPGLRDEILFFHNETKMRNIAIFRYIPTRSLALHIFHLLTPVFFEVDQYIIKQGQESSEVNFFVFGSACAFRMEPKKKPTHAKKRRTRTRQNLFQNMNFKEEQDYLIAREAFLGTTAADGAGGSREDRTGITVDTDVAVTSSAASASAATAIIRPKVSFEVKVDPSSPRDYEETLLIDTSSQKKGAIPTISHTPLRTRDSFVTLAAHAAEEQEAESVKGTGLPSLSAMGGMDEWEKEAHGLDLIGDFEAGDFVGHAGLMKDAPHDCSVVATSACTIYVLTKAVIYKLIHSEPMVGLKLQEALGNAITAQARSLGQSHRRHNRAEFLRDLKDKVADLQAKKDPFSVRGKLASVKESKKNFTSALKAVISDVSVSSKAKKAFFDSTSGKQIKILSPRSQGKSPEKPRVVTKGLSMRVTLVKNARRFQSIRRHLSFKAGDNKISPIVEDEEEQGGAEAAPKYRLTLIKRGKEAEAARKLKKLDHLLNDQTMLYDSDEEDPHKDQEEQAVARMQALVRLNAHLHPRASVETPKKKLQRLLRRALRLIRRNKYHEQLCKQESAGVPSHPGIEMRHRLSNHHQQQQHEHTHQQGGSGGLMTILGESAAGLRRHSFSEVAAPGAEHVSLSERFAANVGFTRNTITEHRVVHSEKGSLHTSPKKPHVTPFQHKAEEDASSRSIFSSIGRLGHTGAGGGRGAGPRRQWSTAVHSVSFGLSAIAALHLPNRAYLTRNEMARIKKNVDLRRRWSFSAMEGATQVFGAQYFRASAKTEKNGVSSSTPGQDSSSFSPSRNIVRKVRRQSFPSLDNDAWRDAHTYIAVL